jgi:lysosomal acid lipase/cholesteryl ester hydrolase
MEDHDDRYANIQQIIEENGFIFEEHTVTTEDGYILKMHRIVPADGAHSRPILLQHGIEDSSYIWVMNSQDKSMAFMLAR